MLIALLLACGDYTAPPMPEVDAGAALVNQPPARPHDAPPPTEFTGQGAFRGPDPSFKLLFKARSTDGLTWDWTPGLLVSAASSPHLTVINGEPTVMYVEHGEYLSRVPLAGGEPTRVDVKGEGEGLVVDPHVVALPEGGYRMYYIYQPKEHDPGQTLVNTMRSARSPDGLSWTREPGDRMQGDMVDPDVVRLPDGRWRMYFTRSANQVQSLLSTDGLSFEKEAGLRINSGGVTSVVPTDAGWSMYFHDPGGLQVTRGDGLTFAAQAERLLSPAQLPRLQEDQQWRGVESPSVLQHDGVWWMVFAAYDSAALSGDAPDRDKR